MLSFTANLLMLITIFQKMFEICSPGHYCVIDTPQTNFVLQNMDSVWNLLQTCVQCALKSHVRPECGDEIEFSNLSRLTCKLKFDCNSIRHQALRNYMPSLLQALTLILTGSFSTAHMVSALKTEFAQLQCYLM